MNPLSGMTGTGGFLGSGEWAHADAVILGAPLDLSVSFRPGTRFGPAAVRSASAGLETYSLALGRDLAQVRFHDCGDLELIPGNLTLSLERIRQGVDQVLTAGKKPFLLGGEHLITVPVLEACLSRYPDLVLLHFDAHADIRENYLGEKLSHASVLSRAGDMGVTRIFSFGIRSAAVEELQATASLEGFHPFSVLEPLKMAVDQVKGRPVYISFDIDVVDPAFAPGTGTPEPGGITSGEALSAVAQFRSINVVAMDLVEVCPPFDPSGITALLAAKLLREALLAILGE